MPKLHRDPIENLLERGKFALPIAEVPVHHRALRVLAMRALREFYEAGRAEAEAALRHWYRTAELATWSNYRDVKNTFNSVDVVNDLYIFNVGGNNYRVICRIDFEYKTVFIRWVGDHSAYDKLNVEEL